VDENVLAGLALDESEALAGIEPLYCSLFFQCDALFYLSYLVLLNCLEPYNKKGRKSELAAPYAILKVIQEQQTQPHPTRFGLNNPLQSYRLRQPNFASARNYLIPIALQPSGLSAPAARSS
jgi:hypothetical protein